MRNQKTCFGRILFVCGGLILSTFSASSLAWDSTGHRLIALLAYQQLPPTARKQWLTLLQAHPRYKQDFLEAMPLTIKNSADASKKEWLFLQLAVWPDWVRGLPETARQKYHHGRWHYINNPLHLDENTRQAASSMAERSSENILKAMGEAVAVLQNRNALPAEKALQLCWLMHLVGDIHAPLHAATLISPVLFPTGDEGGGKIMIIMPDSRRKSLHAYWDQLAGGEQALAGLHITLDKLIRDSLLSAGKQAAAIMNPEVWQRESFLVARDEVYSPVIRGVIRRAESRHTKLEAITLASEYHFRATSVAQQRLLAAGYRLAAQLKGLSVPVRVAK